jgi:threonine dehydratase
MRTEDMAVTVGLSRIRDAQRIIEGKVHRTPVTGSLQLSRRFGMHLFFKEEERQKTGAFKIRGVLNHLHHLPDADKRKGVVTISAGNHAQALAYGASLYGIPATVVMPASAVQGKV